MNTARPLTRLLAPLVLAVSLLAGCASNPAPAGASTDSPSSAASDTSAGTSDTSAAAGDSSSSAPADTTAASTPSDAGTVDIKDLQGTLVSVPSPDKLTSIVETSGGKGVLGIAVLLGQLDKITGTPAGNSSAWIRHAFPQIENINDYGRFDDVNVEAVLQAHPDVIISPSASSTTIDKMRSLGMPVLVNGVEIEDAKDVFQQSYGEIDLMARLTGTEKKADEYYAWANDIFDLVAKRVADIPDSERVTVLPIRQDITQVYGNNCIWGDVVELAGGKNVSGDATASTGKFFADVDAEQIRAWNPDMMFQIDLSNNFDDEAANRATGWANDNRFKGMKAFESKNVYWIPNGIDSWSAAIDAPLGVLWMAKIMYPDRFADIDVKKQAQDFYQTFLNYDLNDEDWTLMAPQFKGFLPNGLTS